MRKTKRYVKVYSLFRRLGGGWSPYTANYDVDNKNIIHVAAYSCKQAQYLAFNHEWYTENSRVGIVEYAGDASNRGWEHADGTHSMDSKYEHGKRFDPSKLNFKEAHE